MTTTEIGQEARREYVERAVHRVPARAAGETRRGAGVDGVVDRADERGLLVPDRGEVHLADAGGTQQQHRAAVGDGAEGLGDRARGADRLDDVGKASHQHLVLLASDHPGPGQVRQCLPVPVVGIAEDDVVRTARGGGVALMLVARQHRHRAVREQSAQRRQRGEPDDAGTDDQHGVAVLGAGAQEPVAGDRDGFVEAGGAIGDGLGHGVEHRLVCQHRLGPPAAEVLGVAQRTTGAQDAAVEVEARRRPAAGAIGAGWVDRTRARRECTDR